MLEVPVVAEVRPGAEEAGREEGGGPAAGQPLGQPVRRPEVLGIVNITTCVNLRVRKR